MTRCEARPPGRPWATCGALAYTVVGDQWRCKRHDGHLRGTRIRAAAEPLAIWKLAMVARGQRPPP
jgi:hypothetical protein